MTDARLPERYLMDRRITRLSDADFRAFVMATLWSVSNRTEGIIDRDDLALIPAVKATAPASLEAAGVWTATAEGWKISDFTATQTTKAQLEAAEQKRISDRERQARHRSKDGKVAFVAAPEAPSVTRDTTRDVTREDKGKASARQGQAEYLGDTENNNPQVNYTTGEVSDSPAPRFEFVRENGKVTRREVAS